MSTAGDKATSESSANRASHQSDSKVQKTTSGSSKSANKSGSGNLFVNILLLAAIGLVCFASQWIKQQISKTQQNFATQIAQFKPPAPTDQPVKPKTQSKTAKKNVMCPSAKADLDSCFQKLNRCKSTEVQFKNAEKEFVKLIQDCARSNEQNQKMNDQMEQEVRSMEENLKEVQKLQGI